MAENKFNKITDRMSEFVNDGLFPGIEWIIGHSGSKTKGSVGYMNLKTQQKIFWLKIDAKRLHFLLDFLLERKDMLNQFLRFPL